MTRKGYVFCGRRDPQKAGGAEVWKNGVPFEPADSQAVYNHSPTGFNWGFQGSGPAQLALALLLPILGRRLALLWYQQFKTQIVAALPAQWVLTSNDITDWFATVKREPESEGDDETKTENPGDHPVWAGTASEGQSSAKGEIPLLAENQSGAGPGGDSLLPE